jgi:hypothetical protein
MTMNKINLCPKTGSKDDIMQLVQEAAVMQGCQA